MAMTAQGTSQSIDVSRRDGLEAPQRYWSLAAIWITMVMAMLDGAIVNIALPTIAQDLGTSPEQSIWVVSAYQIAITMLLLPLAALGEIVSCRRVYLIGVVLFVLASLVCSLTGSVTGLAIARFIQGFGAAAIMALNGALVRYTFPRAMLGRGLGYNSLIVAVSSAAGPTLAAAILSMGSWRWLFAVNVPTGLAALAIGWRFLPETPSSARRFDIGMALLTALTFAALFLVASNIAQNKISVITLAALIAGLGAAALIWRLSRGQAEPLVPFDLIRISLLRLSYATSICSFGAQMMGLVALPFFLQHRLGLGHVETGLVITALPCGVAVAAPLAGRLVDRVPAGLLGGIGLAVLALGYIGLATLGTLGLVWPAAVSIALCGFGFGLFQSPNNRTMLGVAPLRRSGAAAGMLATSRLIGQTMGGVMVALLFRVFGPASVAPFVAAALSGAVASIFSIRRLSAQNDEQATLAR